MLYFTLNQFGAAAISGLFLKSSNFFFTQKHLNRFHFHPLKLLSICSWKVYNVLVPA